MFPLLLVGVVRVSQPFFFIIFCTLLPSKPSIISSSTHGSFNFFLWYWPWLTWSSLLQILLVVVVRLSQPLVFFLFFFCTLLPSKFLVSKVLRMNQTRNHVRKSCLLDDFPPPPMEVMGTVNRCPP